MMQEVRGKVVGWLAPNHGCLIRPKGEPKPRCARKRQVLAKALRAVTEAENLDDAHAGWLEDAEAARALPEATAPVASREALGVHAIRAAHVVHELFLADIVTARNGSQMQSKDGTSLVQSTPLGSVWESVCGLFACAHAGGTGLHVL